jgi:16S rRNA (adenine(1408)-N(1))-methyltransferase
VIVDLGTGDGRAVLAAAAAHSDRLVLGIDPVAAAMAEASRRAALPARRGGLPNAAFVVAAAEALPAELAGIAERVTVTLPWGSLLRGALAIDEPAAAGIAGLVGPGGRVAMLLAPAARDRLDPATDVRRRLDDGLAADWAALGLELLDARPATEAEIAAARSTWARRLGLRADDPERTPFRIELVRG